MGIVISSTKWYAKPTGDMTLSVVDDTGKQILKVDMLVQSTMKAGFGGDKLARAMNDLTVLATIPTLILDPTYSIDMPFKDVGHSDIPWSLVFTDKKIGVKDAKGKKIAGKVFSKRDQGLFLEHILDVLAQGILIINAVYGES